MACAEWRPRQESNLHLQLRRPSYYPLYYEDIRLFVAECAFMVKVR